MAEIRIKDIPEVTDEVASDDYVPIDGASNGTAKIKPLEMIANVAATRDVPSSITDDGVAGEVAFDNDYEYRCVATNTWRRIPLLEW